MLKRRFCVNGTSAEAAAAIFRCCGSRWLGSELGCSSLKCRLQVSVEHISGVLVSVVARCNDEAAANSVSRLERGSRFPLNVWNRESREKAKRVCEAGVHGTVRFSVGLGMGVPRISIRY